MPLPGLLLLAILIGSCSRGSVSFPIGRDDRKLSPFVSDQNVILPPARILKTGLRDFHILDHQSGRILQFDPSGQWKSTIRLVRDGRPVNADLFSMDRDRGIYVTSPDYETGLTDLMKFNPDGTFLQVLGRFTGLCQHLTCHGDGRVSLIAQHDDSYWSVTLYTDDILMLSRTFTNKPSGREPRLILPQDDPGLFLIEWRDPSGEWPSLLERWDARTGRATDVPVPITKDSELVGSLPGGRIVFITPISDKGRKVRMTVFNADGLLLSSDRHNIRARTIQGILLEPFVVAGDRIAETRFTRNRLRVVYR